MIELKRCPFCNAGQTIKEEERYFSKSSDGKYRVLCVSACGVMGPKAPTMLDAVDKWNDQT